MAKKKDDVVIKERISTIEEIPLQDIKNLTVRDIIELFDSLCLPFDEGKGEKEAFFLEKLQKYNASYEEDIGVVVPSVEETKRVVVSHMDLINLFNKGFASDKKYKIGLSLEGEQILMGALDNTFTNAILMKALIELRDQGLAQDTTFVFTEREEIDFGGMRGYLRKYGNKPFFINLDVTPDNRKYNASIEFDEPNWWLCKQIEHNDVFTKGFTTNRVGDDLDAVLRADGQGFSYCIPTFKEIHSYNNYTLIKNIMPYYEGMLFLIDGLNLESGFENDIKELSLTKALKCETQEEFKKAEKKAAKKAKKAKEKERKAWEKRWNNRSSYEPVYKEYSYSEYKDSLFDDNPFSKKYIDYGRGSLLEEDDFLDSLEGLEYPTSGNYQGSFFDDDFPSENQVKKLEKRVQDTLEELMKRGIPELVELNELLFNAALGGELISLPDIYQIVENNCELFSLPQDDSTLIAEQATFIMDVIIKNAPLHKIGNSVWSFHDTL